MKKYIGLNQLPLDAQKVLSLIGEMIDKTNELGPDRVLVLEIKGCYQEKIGFPLLEYKSELPKET